MANDVSARRAVIWLHLGLLVGLVAILEAARVAIGEADVFLFGVFARSLYKWLPALGAISVSIGGPHAPSKRSIVAIAACVIGMMICLDLSVGLSLDVGDVPALYPDASVMAQTSGTALVSWVHTAMDWIRGDLMLAQEARQAYNLEDPRARAAYAISDGPLILVAFGAIGFVVAAMSWVKAHVVFKRGQDAKAFCIVLAWLIAPLVVELSRHFAAQQQARVLFRGAPLWHAAIPAIVLTALGLFAWWYTARYREPDDA